MVSTETDATPTTYKRRSSSPKPKAMSTSTPQPAAVDIPPCTESTTAIQGTQVSTKIDREESHRRTRSRSSAENSSRREERDRTRNRCWNARSLKENERIAPLSDARISRTTPGVSGGSKEPRVETRARGHQCFTIERFEAGAFQPFFGSVGAFLIFKGANLNAIKFIFSRGLT